MLDVIKNKVSDEFTISNNKICTFLNPFSYLIMRRNKELMNRLDVIYFDGYWLCKIYNFMFNKDINRVSFDFSSVADKYFKSLSSDSKVAVIGSDSVSNKVFCEFLNNNYNNFTVIFNRDGYFSNDEERDNCIRNIINLEVDNIIVGMGTPYQEDFLSALKDKGWSGSGYTCGGFIHQTANKGKKYYPTLMDKWNLRFVYRIYDEPKLIKRYAFYYPVFVFLFLYDFFITRSRKYCRGNK